MWADLDNCTVEDAKQRCHDAGLPEPSIVIVSGHGIHLYWLLSEPYSIDDATDPAPVRKEYIEQINAKSKPRIYILNKAGEKVAYTAQSLG